MNPEEYERLAAIEQHHWFYQGKRAIVCGWINRFLRLQPHHHLLDVGTGTGLFVEEFQKTCRATGVEASPRALEIACRRNPQISLIRASVTNLPLRNASIDVSTALDVLEHVPDDHQAFAEMLRVTKKGGLIAITVPAFSKAFSDWDVALGHVRRYDWKDCRLLIEGMPVLCLEKRYINNILFYPILLYRKWRKRYPHKGFGRLEDKLPPPWMNHLFYQLFVAPAMCRWLRVPFGLSILMILKKT